MNILTPFTATSQTRPVHVEADFFQISEGEVLIEFILRGDLTQIAWPEPVFVESRQDGLWQHTCLEAFLSASQELNAPYTEINCAPNGNWNAYKFSSYREGMQPSSDAKVCLKLRESHSDHLRFQISVASPSPLVLSRIGLTAVIEFMNGEKSYWALRHPGPQPDFHNKDGWIPATR